MVHRVTEHLYPRLARRLGPVLTSIGARRGHVQAPVVPAGGYLTFLRV